MVHPVMLLFLIALAIATGPAAEIESKFIELMMARSLARSSVVHRSIVLLLIVITAAVGSMLLGTWLGLLLLAPPATRGRSRE